MTADLLEKINSWFSIEKEPGETFVPLEIKNSMPGMGKGVFAKSFIPAGKIVLKFGGITIPASHPEVKINPCVLQIDEKQFLSLSGPFDVNINHSCNPNCRIVFLESKAYLVAEKDISPGEEITFDYSTTSTETLESWKMNCYCGNNNCRGVISGWFYLPQELVKEYKDIFPDYIKRKIKS